MNLRRIIGLGVLLIAGLSYQGFCGGGKEQQSGGKTQIVIWTGQRADMAYRQQKLEEFNRAHPDIEVKMEIFTDNYITTLELAFEGGKAPDIFQSSMNNATYFAERNMALPLNKYITNDFKARFGELYSIDQVNTVNGNVYTLPERGITFRLIYNTEIFKQVGLSGPPKTLDELYDYAKRITEWGKKNGIYGFATQLKNPAQVGERVLESLAFRSGISVYNYQNGSYDFSGMKPVVDTFRKMYAEGIMFPGVESLEADPMRAQFADGKIGMYVHGNWEATLFAPNGQFPAKQSWAVANLPGVGTANPRGRSNIFNGGKSFSISSTSKNPDAAWKYMEYIFSDDYLIGYHEGGYGYVIIPSLVPKLKSPAIHGWTEFSLNPELDTIWPVRPDTVGLQVEGRTAYDTYASIILGAVNIDTGLRDLTTRYNAALDRAVSNGTMKRIINTSFNPVR